ncbi:MAG: SpoIIE family protein phosphatase [Spirochaetia bacterium]
MPFIEVEYAQERKHSQKICGDTVLLSRAGDGRDSVSCTLSDGLGSGVKANMLSRLCGNMIQKYVSNNIDVNRAARIVMRTLPVCSQRKISYSTFTSITVDSNGNARTAEYDNPELLVFRKSQPVQIESKEVHLDQRFAYKKEIIRSSEFALKEGDRVIFFSDGVNQAGMGQQRYPLGWRRADVCKYIEGLLLENPDISARKLSSAVVRRAREIDSGQAKDDISCVVLFARNPRKLIIASGPPLDCKNDRQLVDRVINFPGKKILAGGTTANIIARETGGEVKIRLSDCAPGIPPTAELAGIDLVTEGILTLSKTAEYAENREDLRSLKSHGASRLFRYILDSDEVVFLIGTRINEAHQDPNMPEEIGIRRTIIRRIANALEKNYVKKVEIQYI